MSEQPVEPPKTKTGEQEVTPATVLQELKSHEAAEKKTLNLQTVVILLSIVGSILGGARLVVVSAWAQAKEHTDAGLGVLRAEFDAHKKEEETARRVQEHQVNAMRTEVYELRKEQRALYDYMKTGREQPILDRPLPPLDGGQ